MKTHLSTPCRILILQTAFIGDVLLTLPLLQSVKKLFPGARLDFLAIPAARNILETHPDIHQLIIYDKRKRDKGIIAFFQLIRRLRENRYDLAVVPHRSIRSAALVWAAGIPRRIGFDRSAGRFFFNHIIPYRRGIHEINRNLHLLDPFGIAANEKVPPKLFFSLEDEKAVFDWMKIRQLSQSENFVALAPGSVWATKRWPPEYFARLANMLKKAGFQIVLIGGEADTAVAREVERQILPPVFNAVGQFTLRQSALLIRQARLLVTNDSAPQHLATAVGTPVAAIFGPTVPAFGFYPYGGRDRVVEIGELPCRPCSTHGGPKCPIGTFECMKNLFPEKVFQEVRKMLETEGLKPNWDENMQSSPTCFRVDSDNPAPHLLKKAAEYLNRGGVILHATETVYGLAARWDDETALQKVSQIKRRPPEQPYSIMIDEIEAALALSGWNSPELRRLLEALFPAPLTLLVPRKRLLKPVFWNQFPEIGFRMPDHLLSRQLVQQAGVPLITTSANFSGEPPPVSIAEVQQEILTAVDCALDSGVCVLKVPSTVVRIEVESANYTILRPGAFPEQRLQELIKSVWK